MEINLSFPFINKSYREVGSENIVRDFLRGVEEDLLRFLLVVYN